MLGEGAERYAGWRARHALPLQNRTARCPLRVTLICALAAPRPHRLAQEVFDLPVDAAQFVVGPGLEFIPEPGVYAQKETFLLTHLFAVVPLPSP